MSPNSTDAWKDIANRVEKSMPAKAGPAVQQMISRMDQIWSFSSSRGFLDNGSGWGSIISHVLETHGAELPKPATIVAGDFSQSMVDMLCKKKQAQIDSGNTVWDRLEVQRLDAHDLKGLEDGSVSHVTGGHLYFLLENPLQGLKATHRVLCPGGVIGLTSGKSSQHIDALCSAVESIKPGTDLKLLKEPWSSEDGVKSELRACGFGDLETYLVESKMSYTNADEFASALLLMPVMSDTIEGMSDNEKGHLQAELAKNLRAMDPDERGELSGTNIVAIGRKAS